MSPPGRPTRVKLNDGSRAYVALPPAKIAAAIERAKRTGHDSVQLDGRRIALARIVEIEQEAA